MTPILTNILYGEIVALSVDVGIKIEKYNYCGNRRVMGILGLWKDNVKQATAFWSL